MARAGHPSPCRQRGNSWPRKTALRGTSRIALHGLSSTHDHTVHHPVRRRRLRHVAVRAGLRARGHARADELRQSRPWRVRDGGRLCLRGAGQPIRLAVLRRAAAGVCRQRR